MNTKDAESSTIKIRAMHQIQHDGVAYPAGAEFTVAQKWATHLIEKGAAQLASERPLVPIEQQAPAGMTPLFTTPGQASAVFVDTKEMNDFNNRQRREAT